MLDFLEGKKQGIHERRKCRTKNDPEWKDAHLCTKPTEKSRKDSSEETYIVEPGEKCAGPNQGKLCF